VEATLTNLLRHVIFVRFANPLCLLPDRGVERPSASFDGPDIHKDWLKTVMMVNTSLASYLIDTDIWGGTSARGYGQGND